MAEMTFWDHLDELRRVLFRVIGVWFVLAIGYFVAMPYLMILYFTTYYALSVKNSI